MFFSDNKMEIEEEPVQQQITSQKDLKVITILNISLNKNKRRLNQIHFSRSSTKA